MTPAELAALMSSADQTWRTPTKILNLVKQIAPIALDPATDAENPTGAALFVAGVYGPLPAQPLYSWQANGGTGIEWDGLEVDWLEASQGGLVFCNPPYGDALLTWAKKFALEWSRGTELLTLTPMRSDTEWFQDFIEPYTVRCCWRGRMKFGNATNSAPFPSVLAYNGPRVARFAEVFEPYGRLEHRYTAPQREKEYMVRTFLDVIP